MRIVPLPGVFQPPSDAWLLADYVKQERLARGANVLDLCTGSGVLAIAAASAGAAHVTAIDISRQAVAATRLNALVNRVRVEAIRGDLFERLDGRRFDLILSNPPYLPGDIRQLPRGGPARAWEGGRNGRAFIDRIALRSRDHLDPDGVLLLVCSTVCGEQRLLDTLRSGGLHAEVVVRRRGPLGPRLAARADWLRAQGLLLDGDNEEILVVRAETAKPAESGFPFPDRHHNTSSPSPSLDRSAPAREAAW